MKERNLTLIPETRQGFITSRKLPIKISNQLVCKLFESTQFLHSFSGEQFRGIREGNIPQVYKGSKRHDVLQFSQHGIPALKQKINPNGRPKKLTPSTTNNEVLHLLCLRRIRQRQVHQSIHIASTKVLKVGSRSSVSLAEKTSVFIKTVEGVHTTKLSDSTRKRARPNYFFPLKTVITPTAYNWAGEEFGDLL